MTGLLVAEWLMVLVGSLSSNYVTIAVCSQYEAVQLATVWLFAWTYTLSVAVARGWVTKALYASNGVVLTATLFLAGVNAWNVTRIYQSSPLAFS